LAKADECTATVPANASSQRTKARISFYTGGHGKTALDGSRRTRLGFIDEFLSRQMVVIGSSQLGDAPWLSVLTEIWLSA